MNHMKKLKKKIQATLSERVYKTQAEERQKRESGNQSNNNNQNQNEPNDAEFKEK